MRKLFIILGVIAVLLGIGAAVAVASIPASGGTINGCYKNNTGDLRVVDSAASCPSGYTSLNWNQTGASGFQMVQTSVENVPISAGGTVTRSITCPSGYVATGGSYGFNADEVFVPTDLYVAATDVFNDPVGSNGGFLVQFRSNTAYTLDITVKAACMDAAT
jgi:hypothetical protein